MSHRKSSSLPTLPRGSARKHPHPAPKKRFSLPPWSYGAAVFLLLVVAFWWRSKQPSPPPAGLREVSPGLYEDLTAPPPPEYVRATPGTVCKVGVPAWAFRSLEHAAHCERLKQQPGLAAFEFFRSHEAEGTARRLDHGTECFIQRSTGMTLGDFYLVRPSGSTQVWWAHSESFPASPAE